MRNISRRIQGPSVMEYGSLTPLSAVLLHLNGLKSVNGSFLSRFVDILQFFVLLVSLRDFFLNLAAFASYTVEHFSPT